MWKIAKVWFVCVGAACLVMFTLESLVVAREVGEARLRDTAWLQLAIKAGRGIGVDLFELTPPLVNRRFDLSDPTDAAQYAGLGYVVSLTLAWSAGALLLLTAWLPRRLSRSSWRPFFVDKAPVLVLAAFAWPGVSAMFWLGADSYARGIHFALGGVLCAIVGVLLVLVTPRPALPEHWITRWAIVNAAAIPLAAIAGFAGSSLAPQFRWTAGSPARPGAPNVLLISIDTLRADHLGCYGYERNTSPAIDRLAAEGVRFENAVSPTSWTLPSHMTMMTGLPPERHRVVRWGTRLKYDVVTIAEVARESGYATAGFVAAPYLEAQYGFSKGFDIYDDHSAMLPPPSHQGITSPTLFGLVDRYLEAWNSADRPAPFFVFLHFWDVHNDYHPPPPFDSMFGPVQEGASEGEPSTSGDPGHVESLARLYDGEIRYVDMHVQKVFQRLEDLGISDETIILITSDHGEEFLDHGKLTHRRQLYEESIHVPLIVRWPNQVSAGQVVGSQVRLQDIAPTLASIIAQPRVASLGRRNDPGDSVGIDLSPLILNEIAEADWEHATPTIVFGSLDHHENKLSYARTNSFKLIKIASPVEEERLFDLRNDPAESTDLATEHPETVVQLRNELATWLSAHDEQTGYFMETDVSDEHKAKLRALGYVE